MMRRLVVGLVFSVASVAHAQSNTDSLIAASGSGVLPGSTGCIQGVDTAITKFRPDIMQDSISYGQIAAHEAVHRAEVKANIAKGAADCFSAFWALTKDPATNLEAEAPAYAAQAHWLQQHLGSGFDQDRFYDVIADRLYFAYNKALPHNYIRAALVLGRLPEHFADAPAFPLPDPMAGTDPDGELYKSN